MTVETKSRMRATAPLRTGVGTNTVQYITCEQIEALEVTQSGKNVGCATPPLTSQINV